MSLEGKWVVIQQWNGTKAYKFPMTISSTGIVEVPGGYFGTALELGGNHGQMSMAVTNFSQQTITAYTGNIVGPAMGGKMRGSDSKGNAVQGIWRAHLAAHDNVEEGEYSVG